MINIIEKFKNQPAVSFDFHDTITLPVWSESDGMWISSFNPNEEIIEEMHRFKCLGWLVYIIHPRPKNNTNVRNFEWFLRDNDLKELIDGKIVYSEEFEKYTQLKNIPNLRIHYDDEAYELELLPPKVMGVKVFHPGDAKTRKLLSSKKK